MASRRPGLLTLAHRSWPTGSEPDFREDGRTKVERAIGTPKVLTEHDGLSK